MKEAHWVINATFEGVSDELANRKPPEKASPVGTAYAHLALSEDAIVNGLLKRQAPLFATTYQDRTGVDRPMPMPGFVEGDLGEWFRSATVEVEPTRAYAREVFANTEEFVAGVDDETLGRQIDLSGLGLEARSFPDVVTMFVVGHCHNLAGEISAVKGVFGLKGYPF
ncbi:MAG: DinB family protein [Actinomycetota bacterium]|nr:DinB family protein [Actinomycetota bacterium]